MSEAAKLNFSSNEMLNIVHQIEMCTQYSKVHMHTPTHTHTHINTRIQSHINMCIHAHSWIITHIHKLLPTVLCEISKTLITLVQPGCG